MIKQQEYKYNGDFSKIVPIDVLEKQVYINAICMTKTLKEAAYEIGVSYRTVNEFVKRNNIDYKQQQKMRLHFKISGIKVKRRFNN